MQESHYAPRSLLPRPFLDAIMALVDGGMQKAVYADKKTALARAYGLRHVPSDIEILMQLRADELPRARRLLTSKPVRAGSGIAAIAVMTKPLPCPHGKCTYCPGGPKSVFGDVPQSYTGNEPASMRGARVGYDIYMQVFTRLEQYLAQGHLPEKVELILMGGTFPSYSQEYQDEVVHDIFQAMDDFSALFFRKGADDGGRPLSAFDLEAFKSFFELPGSIMDKERIARIYSRIREHKTTSAIANASIPDLQTQNEHAAIRCVGFTIETRPSHARREHGLLMLAQGCTRVELGVQTTFDDVLTKVHRDHTVQDTIDAVADLRDLGFKLNFHIMLGMPLMDEARDLAAAHRLFDDPAFRPDMLKLYPCMVMPGTPLYYDFQQGKYVPYSTETAARVITAIKRFIPEYVRVMRIQRDIPTKVITAGVGQTNLRQVVDELCRNEGVRCRCIRCREAKLPCDTPVLKTQEFAASGGMEYFITLEDPVRDTLLGFCRLRFPARCLTPEITPTSAIIRELHVYGTMAALGSGGVVQHRGFGRTLMAEAERIARTHGKDKMLVISGVGVRQYYIGLGYAHDGPYMSKRLA
jgi:elongator complex protein 3